MILWSESKKLSLLCILSLLALPSAGLAQNPPASTEPGRSIIPFQESIPEISKPAPVVKEPAMELMPEGSETITFTLNDVKFVGLNAYSAEEIDYIYKKWLGKEINLNILFKFSNDLTRKYRRDGYIISQAFVPPQNIKNGVVKIEVIEGFISNVRIASGPPEAEEFLKEYTKNISDNAPLHIDDLEKYLLLMREIPGYKLESTLAPSPDIKGAAELLLEVEYDKFEFALSSDNRGTKFIGPNQSAIQASYNSQYFFGSQTSARYVVAGIGTPHIDKTELDLIDLRHQQILNSEGTALNFKAVLARAEPANTLEALNTETQTKLFSINLTKPVIRSRVKNLTAGIGFSFQDTRTTILSTLTAEDRLRVLRAFFNFDVIDKWRGVTQVFGEVSQGLKIMHASTKNSPVLSRPLGRPDFFKANLQVSRLQNITPAIDLYASVSGQFSPHRLLSPEEFGLGGANFGRGYDPSELTGDTGFATLLELRYSGRIPNDPLKEYQLYAFYDFGSVHQSEQINDSVESLASAGLGVRLNMTDWLTSSLEIAKPLTHAVASERPHNGNDPRVYFSVVSRF